MQNTTPSQRAKIKLENPEINKTDTLVEHIALVKLKNIFGSLVPYLLMIYAVSLLTANSASEALKWLICFLIFSYIVIDKFSLNREIKIFKIGGDIWIGILAVIGIISLIVNFLENMERTKDFIDIMGVKHFVWYEFLRYIFNALSWIIPLYLFTYALMLFPGINRLIDILIVVGAIVSVYGIIQHFTGMDLRHLLKISKYHGVYKLNDQYQVVGFLTHHLKYGYCIAMILCLALAKLMAGNFSNYKTAILLGVSSSLMALSIIWTYSRGAWISVVAAVIAMSFFINKRVFIAALLVVSVVCTLLYFVMPDIKSRANTIADMEYNSERTELWNKHMDGFYKNPILGVGPWQNRRLTGCHAHNTYIEWMSSVGVVGTISYLLFILTFMLISYDLLLEIPRNNLDHRSFVLGAIGAQVVVHLGGLTNVAFIDDQIGRLFIFILCILAYMNRKYKTSIIQGDNQL